MEHSVSYILDLIDNKNVSGDGKICVVFSSNSSIQKKVFNIISPSLTEIEFIDKNNVSKIENYSKVIIFFNNSNFIEKSLIHNLINSNKEIYVLGEYNQELLIFHKFYKNFILLSNKEKSLRFNINHTLKIINENDQSSYKRLSTNNFTNEDIKFLYNNNIDLFLLNNIEKEPASIQNLIFDNFIKNLKFYKNFDNKTFLEYFKNPNFLNFLKSLKKKESSHLQYIIKYNLIFKNEINLSEKQISFFKEFLKVHSNKGDSLYSNENLNLAKDIILRDKDDGNLDTKYLIGKLTPGIIFDILQILAFDLSSFKDDNSDLSIIIKKLINVCFDLFKEGHRVNSALLLYIAYFKYPLTTDDIKELNNHNKYEEFLFYLSYFQDVDQDVLIAIASNYDQSISSVKNAVYSFYFKEKTKLNLTNDPIGILKDDVNCKKKISHFIQDIFDRPVLLGHTLSFLSNFDSQLRNKLITPISEKTDRNSKLTILYEKFANHEFYKNC